MILSGEMKVKEMCTRMQEVSNKETKRTYINVDRVHTQNQDCKLITELNMNRLCGKF